MRYPDFRIGNEGQRWTAARFVEWRDGLPEKLELLDGRINGGDEEELLHMLAGLLEHIGADRAVKLGDPEVWRRAVAKLPETSPTFDVPPDAEPFDTRKSRAGRQIAGGKA